MRTFLARRWFLLLLTAGLGLAVLRPGWLRPAADRLPLRGVVALSLFLVAVGLEGRRLWLAVTRPAPALAALAIAYGALPALACLAGRLLPSPDLRLGLLVIASVPCTLSSAVLWTRFARGNEALALLVVVLTTGLSWLATALWLTRATGAAVVPDTSELMSGLAVVLIVPVVLGQLSRALPGVARGAARHRALTGAAIRLLVLAVILRAAADVAGQAAALTPAALALTALACLAVHLAGVALGLWGGRALGFAPADCAAVAFAGSQKTLPVGLFLVGAYYHDYPLAALPLLLYHVGQLVADTFIADALAGRPAAGRDGGEP
jgi:sodium/bile acid cotransporter 7